MKLDALFVGRIGIIARNFRAALKAAVKASPVPCWTEYLRETRN
ncbi:MAG: hypothetical protein N2B03_08625 [Boseongicola sp.]